MKWIFEEVENAGVVSLDLLNGGYIPAIEQSHAADWLSLRNSPGRDVSKLKTSSCRSVEYISIPKISIAQIS